MHCKQDLSVSLAQAFMGLYKQSPWDTHHQAQRIDIRCFGNTLATLSFWAPPHYVSHCMRCPKRLPVDKLEGQVKVPQSHLLYPRLTLVVICPVDQDIIGLHIFKDRGRISIEDCGTRVVGGGTTDRCVSSPCHEAL